MAGTHAHLAPPPAQPVFGQVALGAELNLQPTGSGSWHDTDMVITLPEAGTYDVQAEVRGSIGADPPATVQVYARLWDETAGVMVPGTQRLLTQINSTSDHLPSIQTNTAPVGAHYTVTGPTRIRVQASRNNQSGASTTARIFGTSTLRYVRIA